MIHLCLFFEQISHSKFFLSFLTGGDSEGYSFLMPVLKALIEKSRSILNLSSTVPDLPPTTSGPVFFEDFQMYSTSKQWTTFIEKKVSEFRFSVFFILFYFFLLKIK